jgi:tetratricopeptide (TPR) repeat protein
LKDILKLCNIIVKTDIDCQVAYNFLFQVNNSTIYSQDINLIAKSAELGSLFAKSYLKFISKDFDDSIQLVQEALEADPTNIFGNILKSEIYQQLGDYSTSIQTSERCLELIFIFSNNFDVEIDHSITNCELLIAKCYYKMGDKSLIHSLTMFKKILKSSLTDMERFKSLLGLARTLSDLKQYEESNKSFLEIGKLGLSTFESKVDYAWSLFNLGRKQESLDELLDCDRTKKSGLVKYRIARVYWEFAGKYFIC